MCSQAHSADSRRGVGSRRPSQSCDLAYLPACSRCCCLGALPGQWEHTEASCLLESLPPCAPLALEEVQGCISSASKWEGRPACLHLLRCLCVLPSAWVGTEAMAEEQVREGEAAGVQPHPSFHILPKEGSGLDRSQSSCWDHSFSLKTKSKHCKMLTTSFSHWILQDWDPSLAKMHFQCLTSRTPSNKT